MYKHQLTRLKNGLRLVTIPMPQVESTTVMVGVGAGSRYETKRVNGLLHFIEHMAFKGTKKRPSPLVLTSEIESVGGEFSAFTDKEMMGYGIKLAAKHLELAFDILADMLTNSLFKFEEIERERGVIIEELNFRKDNPNYYIWDVFLRLLYGDNPMGRHTGGNPETVKAIRRQDFLDYIKRLYFGENMAVAVAGKFESATVKKLSKKYFSPLPQSGQKITKPIKIKQVEPRVDLIYRKSEQAHFSLGVSGYDLFQPHRFTLGVLSTILGGGMSSRLKEEIREKRGLAYYVFASHDYFTDSGFLLAQAGVKVEKIEEALRIILTEFEKLKEKKVKTKELIRAKEMIKGHLILALEDSQNVASRYATQLILEERIRTPQQTMQLIDKVTPGDIQRVAKDIFKPEKLNLAIIGPYRDKNRFKKLLVI